MSEYEVRLRELEVTRGMLIDVLTRSGNPEKLLKVYEELSRVVKDFEGYREELRQAYNYGRGIYIVAKDGYVLHADFSLDTIRKVEFLKALEEYWPFVGHSYSPKRHVWIIGGRRYEVETLEDLKEVFQELARLAAQMDAGTRERALGIIGEKLRRLDSVVLDALKGAFDYQFGKFVSEVVRDVAGLIGRSADARTVKAYLEHVKSRVNVDAGKVLRDAIAMVLINAEKEELPHILSGLKGVGELLRSYNVNLLEVLREASEARADVDLVALAAKAGLEVEKWGAARGPKLSV